MVVTRTGVSMHLAGTVAEWLGHVLNVITGRMDRPGGRRYEPGYVDAIRMAGMVKAKPHTSRLVGREMVAGAHALSELPDEITTAGPGQIRAMVINCGNPVVSGPDGAKLDKALGQLDLLVAIDFVQRESHRHAHWLLPAVHWLERDDLLAFTSNMHDEPYLQYGAKAVEPPPGARQEWRIFVDLAIAMGKPLFGAKGLNGFIKATRRVARLTRKPRLEFGPHWIDRLVVATGRKFNGRRIKWRDVMAHPHGWVLGPREFGHFRDALRTDDKKVHAAPPEFVERARELLAEPHPVAPDGLSVPAGEPAQSPLDELVAQRAARPASVGQAKRGRDQSRRRGGARHRRRRPRAGVLPGRRDRTVRGGRRAATPRRGRRRPRLGLKDFRSARRWRSRSPSAPTATCSSTADRSTRCRRPRR